jgi:hypothetical protein
MVDSESVLDTFNDITLSLKYRMGITEVSYDMFTPVGRAVRYQNHLIHSVSDGMR